MSIGTKAACHDWNTYVSPGLLAVGPGRFSVSGVRTTILILEAVMSKRVGACFGRHDTHGTLSLAMASTAADTVAAPPVAEYLNIGSAQALRP